MSIPNTISQEQYMEERTPCILACAGCKRVVVGDDGLPYCKSYLFPDTRWRLCNCNFATHIPQEISENQKSMNALKRSRRRAQGKL